MRACRNIFLLAILWIRKNKKFETIKTVRCVSDSRKRPKNEKLAARDWLHYSVFYAIILVTIFSSVSAPFQSALIVTLLTL